MLDAVKAFAFSFAQMGACTEVSSTLNGLQAGNMVLGTLVKAGGHGIIGGAVATMAFALAAMVHGIWGAAIASGARDTGQAYIAIFYVPPLLLPVLAAAAIGWWLGGRLRAQKR